MRRSIAGCILAASVCGMVAAAGSRTRASVAEDEIARIEIHLAAVSRTLRAASTAHLTEEQRAARRTALDWLDEYRSGGVFPHNHVRPGERVPVFVDPHGTPCAVGFLMLRSGEDLLVEEIVRTNNLVRLLELREDARVAAWLHDHGLTLDEAALVQPQYNYFPPPPPQPPPVASSYLPATVGLSLASVALTSYLASADPRRGAPWTDLLATGTALGHTYMILRSNDTEADEPAWAIGLNLVGLMASVGSEVLGITRQGSDRPGDDRPDQERVAVRPYVAPGPSGTEIGFALRH